MPNWCENSLEVNGYGYENKAQFKKFIKLALANPKKESESGSEEYPLLNNLFPMPKELEGTTSPTKTPNKTLIKKYGFDNWYEWRLENWGTKWDVNARYEDGDEDRATFDFDSAWSPPIEWLHHIQILFPKLHFKLKYDEPGMGFMGVATGTEDNHIQY